MNTRCYRCGWSFSFSREATEEAAIASAGQKAHIIHCPRCRQAISIPMDQIMRNLPPGWTPADRLAVPAATETTGEATPEAANLSAAPETSEQEPAGTGAKPARRHRHSSKTNPGDSAAVSATKSSTHPT